MASSSYSWRGLAIVVALSAQACVIPYPYMVAVNPRVSGQIVDDASEDPLEGVRVALCTDAYPFDLAVATTDAGGRFSFAAQEKLGLVRFLPVLRSSMHKLKVEIREPENQHAELIVFLSAYYPNGIGLDDGERNRGRVEDLGTIRVRRLQRGL